MRCSQDLARLLFASLLLFISPLLSQISTTKPDPHQLFLARLSDAAIERTHHTVRYDPGYVGIAYPNGDVPADSGVCSDEVIRSYRALGIDLQPLVHEDMKAHFSEYPKRTRTLDRNIDHRRVPNLMVFFSRNGDTLRISKKPEDYSPGDLVTWDLNPKRGIPHIGIVVDQKSPGSGRYMIVHNIGDGPQMEDVLFDWKITGHYRYFGPEKNQASRSKLSRQQPLENAQLPLHKIAGKCFKWYQISHCPPTSCIIISAFQNARGQSPGLL